MKTKISVGFFGITGGFILAWLYVWLPALLTKPFFRGAGHWHAAAVKHADKYWLTHSFWVWVFLWTAVTLIAAAWYFTYASSDSGGYAYNRTYHSTPTVVVAWVLVFASLVGTVLVSVNAWFGFKDKARHFNEETYYAVDDINQLPPSLSRLVQGSDGVIDGYDGPFGETDAIFGTHDIPSVVIEQPLSLEGWQQRADSYLTAIRQMTRTSGTEPGSQLLSDTVTFLPGSEPDSGMWTGIRDGRGKQSHIKGIIAWDGDSERAINACEFEGEYRIDRAITGSRGNSLNHALFAAVPSGWWYNIEDVYGYCAGNGEPVLVFPMLKYVREGARAVEVPADVVLVHGTPSGQPRFERFSSVEPGAIPGPVYPISLARTQRDQANWAAGRKWHDNESFGFEPSNSSTQDGNYADYLLRSEEDGRLYWVTPLTPSSSDSQLTIAYSVIPADTASKGELNRTVIYVFQDNDPRVTDFSRLESNVKSAITGFDPGFYASGGFLQEFLPGTAGEWTVFAVDSNGIPKYVIDITGGTEGVITVRDGATDRVVNRLDLSNTVPAEGEAACTADITSLNDAALLACLDEIQNELARRLQDNN